MAEEKTLNLSWDFFLKVSVLVISLYFLYIIKDIVIWFIFSIVLAILFNFLIDILDKKGIPRIISAIFVYAFVLFLVGLFFYATAPIFLSEIQQFINNIPSYFQKLSPFMGKVGVTLFHGSNSFNNFEGTLNKAGEGIISALSVFFGGFQAAIFIIFLAFFLSLERNFLEKLLANFSPAKYKPYLFNLLPRVKKRVNGWFITRVMGMIFVGLLTYFSLGILDIQYSFLLGMVAGVFDFVPMVGPMIAAIIIVLIAAMSSLEKAVFALLIFMIIQQLENNLLFPLLFRKFIGVPPSVVLIALAIGGELWGLIGAILAVPLAGVIFELIKDYLKIKKEAVKKAEVF